METRFSRTLIHEIYNYIPVVSTLNTSSSPGMAPQRAAQLSTTDLSLIARISALRVRCMQSGVSYTKTRIRQLRVRVPSKRRQMQIAERK